MPDANKDKRRGPDDYDTVRIEGMASAEAVLSKNQNSGYILGSLIGGHYEVLKVAGKGGMSMVYKTRHVLIDQIRAVKVLLPNLEQEELCLFRFQQEAKAASRLRHKHIVQVFEFASPADGAPYLVMEYVEGRALGKEIEIHKRLPLGRIQRIFTQFLEAMEHAHSQGVIHRDLKPNNIVLIDEKDGKDFIKLIDFGIAKITAADKSASQGLTPTGEIFGSPQYMSPEQAAGQEMDERSEIYSIGCLLYEMLTGRPPLMGKTVLDTLRMQATVEPAPVSKLIPDLKDVRKYDRILAKCLHKDPDKRYQSVKELRKDFQGIDQSALTMWLDGRVLAGLLALGTIAMATGYLFGTVQTASGISNMMANVKRPEAPLSAKSEIRNTALKLDEKLSISQNMDRELTLADSKIDLGDYGAAKQILASVLTTGESSGTSPFFALQLGRARTSLAEIKTIELLSSRDSSLAPVVTEGISEPTMSAINDELTAMHSSLKEGMDASKLANLLNLCQYAMDRININDVLPLMLEGTKLAALDKENKLPEPDKVKLSLLLANAYATGGDLNSALKIVNEMKPESPLALADLRYFHGVLYLSDTDFEEAQKLLLEAEDIYRCELGESDSKTLCARAFALICQRYLGQKRQAEPAIRKVLDELTICQAGQEGDSQISTTRATLLCILAGERPTVFGPDADRMVKAAINSIESRYDLNQRTLMDLSAMRYPVKAPYYRALAIALALNDRFKSAGYCTKLADLAGDPVEKLRLAKSALALTKDLMEGGFKVSHRVVRAYTTVAALQLDERNQTTFNPTAARDSLLIAQPLAEKLATDPLNKKIEAELFLNLAEAQLLLKDNVAATEALERAQKSLSESVSELEARGENTGRSSTLQAQMDRRKDTQSKIDQLRHRLNTHN